MPYINSASRKTALKQIFASGFANTARKLDHEVKLFLLGQAVECEGLRHEKYDVDGQMKQFVEAGVQLLACGTCLKARQLEGSTECPVSTMLDCVNVVTWADRVVTF